MPQLSIFNFISLDGYYKDQNNAISWHKHGEEEAQFSAKNANTGSTLLFGRITYQMMAGFWTTPMARQSMPEVAEGMSRSKKIVFSTTLETVSWENTQVEKGDLEETIKKLKQESAVDITVLGSGSIVTQLAAAGLI